ncbi:hypothetical protein DPMN_083203 [Dreissena polymorpha]|uniref:C2H2-type domain-containing protein n=1 Tax=Dreissena polymorpha TaxID=45954 RepID=A0A9D3YC67_DREPO|nr:hypothetical protein DPMN_083203 [Dreissena polymorpha]
MEVKTGKVKREKPTMTKKKNKQVPCYNCPNCRVCCSSEDAMLDHFIRKHSSWKVDRPDTLYNQIFQTIPVPVEAVGSSEKMTIITVKMD